MLKTSINLFDPTLLPSPELWSLRLLLQWLLLLAVAFLLIFGVLSYQQQQVQTQLGQQQQKLQQQLQQQEQFQQLLQQRAPDPDLLKQQERLQARIQRAQRLNELVQQHQQPQVLFSDVLTHLQGIDAPELWLKEFRLQQAQSSFHGYSTRSAEVPAWLARLSDLPYFQGQRFQGLQIKQHPDVDVLQFQVEARPGSMP